MTRWVALLKGVNVGGNRKLPMADLKAFVEGLGFDHVTTLLASGNVVFTAREASAPMLELRLAHEAERQLGLKTDFILRNAAELRDIVAANPFGRQARERPNHLLVHFHREPLPTGWVAAVQRENAGLEALFAKGRELFVDYADGIGTSKLPPLMNLARHRRLNTARNWNTVLKLVALTAPAPPG